MNIDYAAARKRLLFSTLARRMPSRAKLYWHGTSSTLLRSILSHGLDEKQIKVGNYRSDERDKEATPGSPSIRSYGGIYFAAEPTGAYGYASDLAQSTGGNPLLIATIIQEHQAVADEDNFFAVRSAFAAISNSGHDYSVAQTFVVLGLQYEPMGSAYNYKTVQEKFRKLVLKNLGISQADLDKRQDRDTLMMLIDHALLVSCRRFLAFITKENGYNPTGEQLVLDAFKRIAPPAMQSRFSRTDETGQKTQLLPKVLRLPDGAKAESQYRRTINRLMVMTRTSGSNSANRTTIRLRRPIGFKGRTRIVCIMEILSPRAAKGPKHVKVHYGKVPTGFFDRASIFLTNALIEWQDAKGNPIGTGKNVKQSTYAADLDTAFPASGVEVNDNLSDLDQEADAERKEAEALRQAAEQAKKKAEEEAAKKAAAPAKGKAPPPPKKKVPPKQAAEDEEEGSDEGEYDSLELTALFEFVRQSR